MLTNVRPVDASRRKGIPFPVVRLDIGPGSLVGVLPAVVRGLGRQYLLYYRSTLSLYMMPNLKTS